MVSNEATVIGFMEFYAQSGQKVNITIRQGATREDIDALLDNIEYLVQAARGRGLYATVRELRERVEAQAHSHNGVRATNVYSRA